ncbi:MAG TPA: preprotein translocase subunit SecG [Nevskia sp.]|nr:preprotein translocase subunit SecG [Nevskia sp.]
MYTFLIVVYVLISAALIGLVLIQHGKGADAGAAFGSGASGTVFGSRGSANFLSRTTAWLAAVFFALSLTLAYFMHGRAAPSKSVVDAASAPAAKVEAPAAAPAAPATPKTDQPAAAQPAAPVTDAKPAAPAGPSKDAAKQQPATPKVPE